MGKMARFLVPVVLVVIGGFLASESDFGIRFTTLLVFLGIGLTVCFALLLVDAGTGKGNRWAVTKGEFAMWAAASQTLLLAQLISISDLEIQVLSVFPIFPIAFGFDFLCISLFLFILSKMFGALK